MLLEVIKLIIAFLFLIICVESQIFILFEGSKNAFYKNRHIFLLIYNN